MKSFVSVTGKNWLQGRWLLPLLERHGRDTSGRVLDLGCGSSPWRPFFSAATEFVRMDRTALDPSVIVLDDIYRLPIEDAAIEVVIASRILGDVPDLKRLMAEISRILAPEGRILVYEAISYPQHDLPHDYWRVLPAGLKWAAEGAGLRLSELAYCGGYFTQIAMQLNTFIVGNLDGTWLTRPFASILRAATNLTCAGLDRLSPRPELATDYFACLVKARFN